MPFLATGTSFVEDNFSWIRTGVGVGLVWGCFKCITFIVHFISLIITLAPTTSAHQALDPGGWELPALKYIACQK